MDLKPREHLSSVDRIPVGQMGGITVLFLSLLCFRELGAHNSYPEIPPLFGEGHVSSYANSEFVSSSLVALLMSGNVDGVLVSPVSTPGSPS